MITDTMERAKTLYKRYGYCPSYVLH